MNNEPPPKSTKSLKRKRKSIKKKKKKAEAAKENDSLNSNIVCESENSITGEWLHFLKHILWYIWLMDSELKRVRVLLKRIHDAEHVFDENRTL